MKISELVEELEKKKAEHGDVEVRTEGCDCDGPAGGVAYYNFTPPQVLITRHAEPNSTVVGSK